MLNAAWPISVDWMGMYGTHGKGGRLMLRMAALADEILEVVTL